MMRSDVRSRHRAVRAMALITIALVLAACAGTRGRRGAPEFSGFLRDYSQLTEEGGATARLSYLNPKADWGRYDAIWIESVSLWRSSDAAKLEPEEAQQLTDYLYQALHEELSKSFRMASGPGVGVIQFRAALTEAKGANVPAKAITTVVPQLNLASTLVGVGGDLAVTVGEATIEAEVLDSMTKLRLGAVVDQQAGRKSVTQLKKWSDVKVACEHWAEALREDLIREGVREKP